MKALAVVIADGSNRMDGIYQLRRRNGKSVITQKRGKLRQFPFHLVKPPDARNVSALFQKRGDFVLDALDVILVLEQHSQCFLNPGCVQGCDIQ